MARTSTPRPDRLVISMVPIIREARTLLVAFVLCLGGCGGGEDPVDPGPPAPILTSIVVTPTPVTIVGTGTATPLVAVARDQNGSTMAGVTFSWATTDPAVATVAAAVVTSIGLGTASITASSGAVTSAPVVVTVEPLLTSVAVTPPSSGFTGLGEDVTLVAEGLDQADSPIAGLAFSWSSSDPAVATVTDAGVVTSVADGDAMITASSGAVTSAGVPITVRSWTSITAGGGHSCALTAAGEAFCWGSDGSGELGAGVPTRSAGAADSSSPVPVSGGHTWQSIEAGLLHTCGVTTDGAGYCWGSNTLGTLGNGTTTNSSTPTAVLGDHTFQAIFPGDVLTCGLRTDGLVFCWGRNNAGQLGDGTLVDSTIPVPVAGANVFVQLSVAREHSCGRLATGIVLCWGSDEFGELGRGVEGAISTQPTPVTGGLTFSFIVAAGRHTCGITVSPGTSTCWGINDEGQLGLGTTVLSRTPAPVGGGLIFQSISAGFSFTCGITAAGAAYCWGLNTGGQLGDGSGTSTTIPVPMGGELVWIAMSHGGEHACGLTTANAAYCWGVDDGGKLGQPPDGDQLAPIRVSGR